MTKRGNGEGSIAQRKDGVWQSCLSLPSGKRKYFYGKTRQDVARKLAAAIRDRDRGVALVSDERLTVEQYLTQWLDRMKPPRLETSTHLRYTQQLAHVIRAHGRQRLTSLTAHQITLFYARLQQPKAAGGAGLSASSAHHIHVVLHGALSEAAKLDLVPNNVTERVNAPKLRPAEVDPYTREEADRLLEAARGDRLEALYVLAVTTGMRLGELLALTWRQVDLGSLENRGAASLRIIETAKHDAHGRWTVGKTKTRASRRRIELIPRTRLALLRHQAQQRTERDEFERTAGAGAWQKTDLVFTTTVGGLLDEGNVGKRSYKALLTRAGLPYRHFHTLRHTCAALLLADGVPLYKVSALLGHASINITANLYGHLAKSEYERDASNTMERLFGTTEEATEDGAEEAEEG